MVPLHELVQAAHLAHKFITGTQVKMVRIAQHEGCIDLLKMFRGKGFDRRLRANRGKDRSNQIAMWCGEDSSTGAVVFSGNAEFKHRADYTGWTNNLREDEVV